MFASKMKKAGGFIGLDALQARLDSGSHRRLLHFLLDDSEHLIYHNEPIFLDDQLVGTITTGTYGHTLGAPLGLGWVTLSDSDLQTNLEERCFEVLVAGRKVRARASQKPLYDPLNQKLRH